MKKKYEKPLIYMEKFELAEHIAGCSLTINNTDVVVCTAEGTIGDLPSEAWFVPGNTLCAIEVEDYCYTNSSNNIATINS